MRRSGRASCSAQRQIDKLAGAVEREGMTIVPLKLYFNEKGRAKLEIALARGKKLHDKRETEEALLGAGAREGPADAVEGIRLLLHDPAGDASRPLRRSGRSCSRPYWRG